MKYLLAANSILHFACRSLLTENNAENNKTAVGLQLIHLFFRTPPPPLPKRIFLFDAKILASTGSPIITQLVDVWRAIVFCHSSKFQAYYTSSNQVWTRHHHHLSKNKKTWIRPFFEYFLYGGQVTEKNIRNFTLKNALPINMAV